MNESSLLAIAIASQLVCMISNALEMELTIDNSVENITSTRAHGYQVWEQHLCVRGTFVGTAGQKHLNNAI